MADEQDGPRVLFLDDERELLAASEVQLRHLGLRVTGHTNGVEALAELARDPYAFDVLVTDLLMPIMDGQELIGQARRIRADLPVILLTGMREAVDPATMDTLGPIRVMGKPLRMADLVHAVRELMDHRP